MLDLYACPTERERWPRVLDQVCGVMRARSAVVQVLVRDGLRTRSRWTARDSNSEAVRAVHDRYFGDAVNPRMLAQRAQPWRGQAVVRDRDFFAPGDPLYLDLQQRLHAARLGQFLSVRFPISDDASLALILHRELGDSADFTRPDEQFALGFMPHLHQAVQLATMLRNLTEHVQDLHQTANNIRTALVLCNADATVCWLNRAAEHVLGQRKSLWVSGEKLTTGSTQDTTLLRQAIWRAAEESIESEDPQLLVLGRRCEANTLQVQVQGIGDSPPSATPAQFSRQRRRVLLVLADPSASPALPADLLRVLFALSPAESRLAAALSGGKTVEEYADASDVSVGTARYQLKQVMAKMQVTRQSQLVRRLYASVVAQTFG